MQKLLTALLALTLLTACGAQEPATPDPTQQPSEEITTTNGVKHSVPLSDILQVGSNITIVNDPVFVSVEQADQVIDPENPGLAIDMDGVERFYPFGPSGWHIVNEEIAGTPVLVTYCPICATGIVFDPVVDGVATTFDATGELWNSNMVMIDAHTGSLWSQILGEAIKGPSTGEILALLPHQNIRWKDWKEEHPNGEVLNFDLKQHGSKTAAWQRGTYDPDVSIRHPLDNYDQDYTDKSLSYGIGVDGTFKVYFVDELNKTAGTFTDEVGGIQLQVDYNLDDETILFTRLDLGTEVVPTYGFWFAWYAVHPETEVFTP